ncbi:MAG: gephyrin-like molybdotransferase Glp [Methanoregula sp.]
MSKFLHPVDVAEAVATSRHIAPDFVPEDVPADCATGRVLCEDVIAREDIPGFDRSVVDGFAVNFEDTTGSSESIPALLNCGGRGSMGAPEQGLVVSRGRCAYIPTGGVLPEGADAVIMVEHTERAGDTVLVKRPVVYGENVLFHDEDYRRGAVILQAGRRLTPQDTGVLAACGRTSVAVARRPVIGIISTGNELVPVTATPGPGQVRDANASMLAAYLNEYGCDPLHYGIVRDEYRSFEDALSKALPECDAILISGGSSKDDRDMTAGVIAGNGEVLVHGITLAPGKPTIIGRIGTTPVFGLPGHPASAYVVLIVVVLPLISHMLGEKKPCLRTTRAVLGDSLPSQKGREEYIRVRLEERIAYPVFGKSGLLNTLVNSDGLVCIPAGCEGLEKGCEVDVILW